MILSGEARLAGVMGWPVGHSLSPRLHGYWLRKYEIDGAYVPLAVGPGDFAEAIAALPRMGFAGTNITLPHKQAALAAVDAADPGARRVGAVNTIVVGAEGDLAGSNTDGFGFMENLTAGAPDWDPRQGPAVVLGAGGAARSIVAALVDAGVSELRLINRNFDRAEALAADIGGPLTLVPWSKRHESLEGAALLVNATSQGMTGNPPLELALDSLPDAAVVNDIVYTPLRTTLLAAAENRGNRAVDGLGMLLHQARPGFAAWFGVEPDVTEDLRSFVLHGMRER